jgi:hypothetical protein
VCLLGICGNLNAQSTLKLRSKAEKRLRGWEPEDERWGHLGEVLIDSVFVDLHEKVVGVYCTSALSYRPFREDSGPLLKESIVNALRRKFKDYTIQVFSGGYEIEELIPNYYRKESGQDHKRLSNKATRPIFLKKEDGTQPAHGLANNHIALWHSHGWYYESKLDRWEWQRARLFGTVEDIYPLSYVLPYLVPMLENAGATVFLPRERDVQKHEIIVDNDTSTGQSQFKLLVDSTNIIRQIGFCTKDTLFTGENPFHLGTSLAIHSRGHEKIASYVPDVPEKGNYAVYVAYQQRPENSRAVGYRVHHTGGVSSFELNQTMGGGTWIYLGTFHFNAGYHPARGSVNVSAQEGMVSLDAIRFGGGTGNVARRPAHEVLPNNWSLRNDSVSEEQAIAIDADNYRWKTSGRPRYLEAARYWLQYAGMPDTLVYSLHEGKNDYNDDYKSRGEWVDFLMGAPNGPTNDRMHEGLCIPIDLAFAFHTDAGITPGDSVIGTLGIYSSVRDSGYFPNGQSKLASRDLTDLIQTQVVVDIQALYKPDWTRRGMWDKQYSEAWRPNVPTMLLELLSHQNLGDMKLGLDPRFRFHVSRAVYKGMLRFLAHQEGRDYVVQPLPVDHMAIERMKGNHFRLSWKPVEDPLEPTSLPTHYKVYKRIGSNGFDNGVLVDTSCYQFQLDTANQIVSFKVCAVNDGGESMPGEILAVGIALESTSTVLVVNAFDRVSAPAFIDKDGFAGVAWWEDQGVPDRYELGHVGKQYDYNRKSPWLDDDSPGWGASYGNDEGVVIPGNTFDFPYVHGKAILAAGHSFISVSDEVFEHSEFKSSSFKVVDVILGEEKTQKNHLDDSKLDYQLFSPGLQKKVSALTSEGVSFFISGANVGSDFILQQDTLAEKFAADVLHYKWRTNHAVKTGQVYSTDYVSPIFRNQVVFNTEHHPAIYSVEAPDAIEPANKQAVTAWRYAENNSSAGILCDGAYKTAVLGFPFESILNESERNQLMKDILDFLTTEPKTDKTNNYE